MNVDVKKIIELIFFVRLFFLKKNILIYEFEIFLYFMDYKRYKIKFFSKKFIIVVIKCCVLVFFWILNLFWKNNEKVFFFLVNIMELNFVLEVINYIIKVK